MCDTLDIRQDGTPITTGFPKAVVEACFFELLAQCVEMAGPIANRRNVIVVDFLSTITGGVFNFQQDRMAITNSVIQNGTRCKLSRLIAYMSHEIVHYVVAPASTAAWVDDPIVLEEGLTTRFQMQVSEIPESYYDTQYRRAKQLLDSLDDTKIREIRAMQPVLNEVSKDDLTDRGIPDDLASKLSSKFRGGTW